jgi:hypothetical protein
MTGRQRDAIVRLVIVCAAWALGDALEYAFGANELGPILPLILAAAAFMATQGMSWPGGSDDETYWRGRRIDRDSWRH